MARFLRNKEASHGQVPGSAIFIGEKRVDDVTIKVIDYDPSNISEFSPTKIQEISSFKETKTVTWINILGLHEPETIKAITDEFGIHPLVSENILYTGQRPKMEEYDDYLFFVCKIMHFDNEKNKLINEQISMIVGKNYLLTFQERFSGLLDPVRHRIRKNKGRIRKVGADYLAYAILDTVIENSFSLIEKIGEEIEDLETEIIIDSSSDILGKIQFYKREMNYLRKTLRPTREFLLQASRIDSDLVHEKTIPFFKDLLDITTHAVEIIDTYRDMLTDFLAIFNTGISNKMNEIMKVLTIFSAIFIPLTFIAGIYGTNFEYLPELKYQYSYFIFWGVLLVIAYAMIKFFQKKGWL